MPITTMSKRSQAEAEMRHILGILGKDNEKFLEANRIVKARACAEARLKKLAQDHKILNVIVHKDKKTKISTSIQFNVGSMRRISTEKIPFELLEDYKDDVPVWRKNLTIKKL